MTDLSGRLTSSPVTEPVPNRANWTTRKSLDLLADTMVKLKDKLRKVRGEMAALREDKAETSWANLSNYANGIQQGKNHVMITPKAPIASKVVDASKPPVTLQPCVCSSQCKAGRRRRCTGNSKRMLTKTFQVNSQTNIQ